VSEKAIQISLKRSSGTIPLFRGDSVDEISALIESAVVHPTFIKNIEALEEALLGSQPAPKTTISTAEAVNNIAERLGGSIVTSGDAPSRHCLHGKMTAIEGNGQWGLYRGFFCAAPKGATDKCSNIYLKNHDPDYANFVADKVANPK
jgi:hypothetical protein